MEEKVYFLLCLPVGGWLGRSLTVLEVDCSCLLSACQRCNGFNSLYA